VIHAVAEHRAVRESGERVVEGLVSELLLEHLAVRHVARVQDEPAHGRILDQAADDALHEA